jgi:hypothetical protein
VTWPTAPATHRVPRLPLVLLREEKRRSLRDMGCGASSAAIAKTVDAEEVPPGAAPYRKLHRSDSLEPQVARRSRFPEAVCSKQDPTPAAFTAFIDGLDTVLADDCDESASSPPQSARSYESFGLWDLTELDGSFRGSSLARTESCLTSEALRRLDQAADHDFDGACWP